MTSTAAHLVDRVLPTAPYRQWVLSLPRQVRFLLARDRELLGRVVGVFLRKVFAWQRRHARVHEIADPHTGSVTFVQRFGSLLNLNCHARALIPDGVFTTGLDGTVSFHALPPPWDDDIVRLLDQIARAIHRLVERRVADHDDDAPPDLLAAEQADAVAHMPTLGDAAQQSPGRRSASLAGYSLHADRLVDADDRDGLERLCRYGARSPVANSRLARDGRGRVVMSLKRPLRDGRTELAFEPVEFLRRLATLIPPPYAHLTRFHGVFAPNHRLRAAVVPAPATSAVSPRAPCRRFDWSALMKRVFAVDVLVCDVCAGAMPILAVLPESEATRAILEHLEIPTLRDRVRLRRPSGSTQT
jgi:Putative transposase